VDYEYKNEAESPEDASRRTFFASATIFLGGLVSSVLGWNLIRYFISPIWNEEKGGFIPICSLGSLPKDQPFSIEYVQRVKDGWEIHEGRDSLWLVLGENGEITAFNKSCTHLGCPYRWDDNEKVFKCPCHTATFAKNGEVLSGPPPRSLDRFPVKVEHGIVLVKPETIIKEKE